MKRRAFISGVLSTFLLSFQRRIYAVEAVKMVTNSKNTGLVDDPVFLQHHITPGHPETPDRVKFIHNALKETGLIEKK